MRSVTATLPGNISVCCVSLIHQKKQTNKQTMAAVCFFEPKQNSDETAESVSSAKPLRTMVFFHVKSQFSVIS